MLNRRFPQITLERLMVAVLLAWVASFVLWLCTPQTMPPWVGKMRIPDWFAHNWPWSIVPAFLLFTFFAYRKGWTKLPPISEAPPSQYNDRRDLSTKEVWRLQDKGTVFEKTKR